MERVDNLRISYDFRWYNSIFMEKNCSFKKYHLQRKFLFQKIVVNFVIFWHNNNIFMQKKVEHLKNIIHDENLYLYN